MNPKNHTMKIKTIPIPAPIAVPTSHAASPGAHSSTPDKPDMSHMMWTAVQIRITQVIFRSPIRRPSLYICITAPFLSIVKHAATNHINGEGVPILSLVPFAS